MNINFIAEACGKLTFPLGITCRITGIPTTKEEWLESYEEQIGKDPVTQSSIYTNNPEEWSITWEQVQEKVEELKISIPLNILRFERDHRIAETDWWVLPDRTPTQEQLDYRQSLRDITNHYTSLDDVVWPVKPT